MLKGALNQLFLRWITFDYRDAATGEDYRAKFHWISEAHYSDGAGSFKLVFSERLVPHLTRIDGPFTRITLKEITGLNSAHALRLYEQLARFKSTGVFAATKEELRFCLAINPDEYKLTADFNRYVLKPAVAEINEKTNYRVRFDPTRKGKFITGWTFFFYEPPSDPELEAIDGFIPPFDKKWVEQHARPGLTYEQARAELYPIYKRDVLGIVEDDGQNELPI